jgi:iron-sulfur cluster assembly protein
MKMLPVRLSDAAIREISSIMERKNIPAGYGLRLGVKGGGCAGVQFLIGFDQPKPGDEHFSESGFLVFIEKKHFLHLAGMKVDFLDNEKERGFVFESDNQC